MKEPISMDSTENANAAMPSADEAEEEEADSDTHDKCAHKNCRRLRYEDINWVQVGIERLRRTDLHPCVAGYSDSFSATTATSGTTACASWARRRSSRRTSSTVGAQRTPSRSGGERSTQGSRRPSECARLDRSNGFHVLFSVPTRSL